MRTNANRMKQGGSPYVLKNGQYEHVQLHHSRQDGRGALFETSKSTHLGRNDQNSRQAVHPYSPQQHPDYPVNREVFDKDQYWKDRLNQLQGD
ncbi:HNH/ENDO VII family nuclease [Psychrobacter piscatorii]|uniref:HNH/ENDO VII family nuclease n=1 Tax=Psychrobacter piscatorii TaxID=554343 RepID=UPI002233F4A5|nr:HNH/ENDO VII family nuclease [Psychrobacter piscatorii]